MVQPVTTNKTSILLNAIPEPTPQRTYVTFGVERGGTSLVAGVLRALGLYLGDIPEGNNEDKSFHNKPLGQMKSTIARRNQEYDVWGWKYPTASTYLPVLCKSIRNAFFIVVYRDVVATALSRAQWDGEFIRRNGRMSLHETNAIVNANTGFALATRRPCPADQQREGRVPDQRPDRRAGRLPLRRQARRRPARHGSSTTPSPGATRTSTTTSRRLDLDSSDA